MKNAWWGRRNDIIHAPQHAPRFLNCCSAPLSNGPCLPSACSIGRACARRWPVSSHRRLDLHTRVSTRLLTSLKRRLSDECLHERQEAIMFGQGTHAYCGRTRSTQQSVGCLRRGGLFAVRGGGSASEETSGRLDWRGKTFWVKLV